MVASIEVAIFFLQFCELFIRKTDRHEKEYTNFYITLFYEQPIITKYIF